MQLHRVEFLLGGSFASSVSRLDSAPSGHHPVEASCVGSHCRGRAGWGPRGAFAAWGRLHEEAADALIRLSSWGGGDRFPWWRPVAWINANTAEPLTMKGAAGPLSIFRRGGSLIRPVSLLLLLVPARLLPKSPSCPSRALKYYRSIVMCHWTSRSLGT